MARTETALITKRNVRDRVLDYIFGYDFFVSYNWADGAVYASSLVQKLEAYGFQVFFDRNKYIAGENWRSVGSTMISKAGHLILVGSRGALHSVPVRVEVESFRATRRRIIPIDFGGSLDIDVHMSSLADSFSPDEIRIKEETCALSTGPSEAALSEILKSFKLVKQDRKRSRILAAVVLSLLVLLAAALWFGYSARKSLVEAEEANARESQARKLADGERQKAFDTLIGGVDRLSDFSDVVLQSIRQNQVSRDSSTRMLHYMEDAFWRVGEGNALNDFRKSQISMMFQKIASSYFFLGDRARSLAVWTRFVDFSRRLVVENPDNPALVTALAAALIRSAGERASNADRSGQVRDLLEAVRLLQQITVSPTVKSFMREGFASGSEIKGIAIQNLTVVVSILADLLREDERESQRSLILTLQNTLDAINLDEVGQSIPTKMILDAKSKIKILMR